MDIHRGKLLVIFALLGPPMGLLVLGAFGLIQEFVRGNLDLSYMSEAALEDWINLVVAILDLLLISYPVAVVPSLLAGIGVYWISHKRLKGEIFFIALIGAAVGLAYVYFLAGLNGPSEMLQIPSWRFMPLTLLCLVTTLICWLISKRLAKP